MQSFLSSAILLAAFSWFAIDTPARADEFSAVEHQRQTIYRSPQKPEFTSWVGAWTMPDGSQAGGGIEQSIQWWAGGQIAVFRGDAGSQVEKLLPRG